MPFIILPPVPPQPDVLVGILPYNGSLVLVGPTPDFGARPQFNTTGPSLTWPNPDGPSLENTTPPDPINDSNTSLIKDPPFSVTEDHSQIRNRVVVLGAGTVVTTRAFTGDSSLEVADISIFSPSGGQIMVNGIVLTYFSPASLIPGEGTLFLDSPIATDIDEGSVVRFYLQLNDIESQQAIAAIDGTTGVIETVISDTSLLLPQQMYMAGNAELELFSKPIVTIKYATRDPKTRSGSTVHVDLTNPPCQGDFLIQDVTIDQYKSEQQDSSVVAPRYTVTASSVKFELSDLLLQIIESRKSGGPAIKGVVKTAVAEASDAVADPLTKRVIIGYHLPSGAAVSYRTLGIQLNGTGTVPVYDAGVETIGNPNTTAARKVWATLATSAVLLNNSSIIGTEVIFGEDNFEATFNVRTGPSVADILLWVGLSGDAILGTIATSTALAGKMISFRYAPTEGDTGWVGMVKQAGGGAGHSKTDKLSDVLPNTEYTLKIRTQLGPDSSVVSASFRVDSGSYVTIAHDANFPVPIPVFPNGLTVMVACVNKIAAIKKFQWRRLAIIMD